MSIIDKILVDRFNINFCEDYTRTQLKLYAKKQHIYVNNPTKNKLCHEIRRQEFLDRFWKDNYSMTRFRGTPYHVYLSLLYLRSLNLPNVDVFVPNYIEGKLDYNNLCITWNITNNKPKLTVPPSFEKFINNSQHQFVVIILGQSLSNEHDEIISGHANLLIFDRVNKTIERFEPHGVFSPSIYLPELCDEAIFCIWTEYNYIPTIISCPFIGPQILQTEENEYKNSDPIGFCVAWVIWYAEFKFTYQNTTSSSRFLDMYLNILKDVSLTKLIRKYAEHILLIGEDIRSKIVTKMYYQ